MLEHLARFKKEFSQYTELRWHNNHLINIAMQNGSLINNETRVTGGVSARCYGNGVFGFGSAPNDSDEAIRKVIANAQDNVRLFKDQPQRGNLPLPQTTPGTGTFDYRTTKTRFSATQRVDIVRQLNEYLTKAYPDLVSIQLQLSSLAHEKALITSEGASTYSYVPGSNVLVVLAAPASDGVVTMVTFLGKGGDLEDVFSDIEPYKDQLDELYRDLRAKAEGVLPTAGYHDVVMGPALAGILAHEAIGHTVEGDIVLGGSIAASNLGKRVAAEKVTLVDIANNSQYGKSPVPVNVDDEGTPCRDVVIIENGILKEFLTDKETARDLGMTPSGNARAFAFSDEPLVRMRNTIIQPGSDHFEDMISAVEDGYYLKLPFNGQADSTSEFMFAIMCGYEIKNGKLGRGIRDTTISGIAFDMLKTVTHVSNDMKWFGGGMCGKKQPMTVGMGGPALKCKINLGGR